MTKNGIPEVGKNYFVRTITDHWIGTCVGVGPNIIILNNVSWVADSGRLSVFMATGRANNMEIEVLPPELLVRCIGTVIEWPHPLFKESK